MSGTLGWFGRPVLRGERMFIADDPRSLPPDLLLQQLIGLGIVEVDEDQSPPAPPAPPKPLSIAERIRERIRLWRRNRAATARLRQSPFRNIRMSDAIVPVAREEVPLPPAARSQLWTPGMSRPLPTLAVVECRFGCRDAAGCTHVRA